jgi:hypothetical protein
MDYNTAEPNARFWVLKLLKDNLGPGDTLAKTSGGDNTLSIQAFETKQGKALLVANKRGRAVELTLPLEFDGGGVAMVAPSTGDHAAGTSMMSGRVLKLEPFEVALVRVK